MTSINFECKVLGVTNLFAYEGRKCCVAWKKGLKKESHGSTKLATIKKNTVTFKHKFSFTLSLHPLKKGTDSFKSKKVEIVVKEETRGKLKEIAHATLDVSKYVGRNVDGEAHSVALDVEWAVKPSSAFQSLLKKNPGQILLSIDPVNSKITASASPRGASGGSAALEEQPASEESEEDPVFRPSHSAPRREPSAESVAAAPAGNNPFASLSRKVGEDPTPPVAAPAAELPRPTHKRQSSRSQAKKSGASPRVPRINTSTTSPGTQRDSGARISSRGSSSTGGSLRGGKDKKKVSSDVKKLREQLQKSENARMGLERKLQHANKQIKMLEKHVPKNDLKMMKRELGGNPFGATDEDFEVKSADLTGDDLLRIVQDVVRRKDTDHVTVYWLSWCANLHTVMIPEAGVGAPLSETGIVQEAPRSDASTPHARYVFALERVIQALYGKVLERIRREINVFVQRKADNFFDVEVEVSGLGLDLVAILNRYLVAMRGTELPRTVLNQFFCQVFYYINCALFNAFLRNASLCEPAIAMQLKFYFSEMENWSQENKAVLFHWAESFKKQLLPIMDFTNLLLLGKNNISAVMLKTAAPYIPLRVVKFMLDTSTDTEPVPRSVLKEISLAAGYDEHDKIMLDEVLFSEDLFLTCEDVSNPSNIKLA